MMRTLPLVTVLLLVSTSCTAARQSALPGQIHEEVDRFRGQRVLYIDDMTVVSGFDGQVVQLDWYAGTEGVSVSAATTTKNPRLGWRWLKCHHVDWLVDGAAVRSSPPEHDGSVRNYGISEYVRFAFDEDGFGKIADAAEVEWRLCFDEFRLTSGQIEAIRELRRRRDSPPGEGESP